jgi:hypothetical protein
MNHVMPTDALLVEEKKYLVRPTIPKRRLPPKISHNCDEIKFISSRSVNRASNS